MRGWSREGRSMRAQRHAVALVVAVETAEPFTGTGERLPMAGLSDRRRPVRGSPPYSALGVEAAIL
jgi:hypothetical protein